MSVANVEKTFEGRVSVDHLARILANTENQVTQQFKISLKVKTDTPNYQPKLTTINQNFQICFVLGPEL